MYSPTNSLFLIHDSCRLTDPKPPPFALAVEEAEPLPHAASRPPPPRARPPSAAARSRPRRLGWAMPAGQDAAGLRSVDPVLRAITFSQGKVAEYQMGRIALFRSR